MNPMDLLILHIELEITENIIQIMQKWCDIINTPIDVFSMNELPENLSGMKNNLAVALFHQITGSFIIYTSEYYVEAHIIHEILHPLLRANNYVQMSPLDSFVIFMRYPNFMNQVKSYAMTVTNQMDHLIIHQQMREFDLDFDKLAIIEYKDALKLECNPHYENDVERILNNMLMGLNYFDYVDMVEPYQSELINNLKENNEEAYKYGVKYYNLVSNNGYVTQEEYRESMEILLKEMKRDYKKVKDDESLFSYFFDFIRVN